MRKRLAVAAMTAVLLGGGLARGQTSPGVGGDHGMPGAATTAPGGSTSPTHEVTIGDVQQKLEQQGYSKVTGLVRQGDEYVGQAVTNGHTVIIHVDVATGRLLQPKG